APRRPRRAVAPRPPSPRPARLRAVRRRRLRRPPDTTGRAHRPRREHNSRASLPKQRQLIRVNHLLDPPGALLPCRPPPPGRRSERLCGEMTGGTGVEEALAGAEAPRFVLVGWCAGSRAGDKPPAAIAVCGRKVPLSAGLAPGRRLVTV